MTTQLGNLLLLGREIDPLAVQSATPVTFEGEDGPGFSGYGVITIGDPDG